MQAGQVVSLIIVVAFIFGAFYARHYILRRMSGHGTVRARNKSIAILDSFAISRDKSFVVLEIAGRVYIVAMTNQSATLLDALDAAAFSKAAAESRDRNAQEKKPVKVPAGNSLYARMTRSLARFMAARMGRTLEFEDDDADAAPDFSETMKTASAKDNTAGAEVTEENPLSNPEEEA